MTTPLYIATERFDSSDGAWQAYCEWAKIPNLKELVSLDCALCKRIVTELLPEDWPYRVKEDFRLDYFCDLDYLLQRTQCVSRKNILGLYRNPQTHILASPAPGNFEFIGYDLLDENSQISAITNCGGFPDVFLNDELNLCGLIEKFDRAINIQRLLIERHPEEPHAKCELYAIWRLNNVEKFFENEPRSKDSLFVK